MKCPHCHKGELAVYNDKDIINDVVYEKTMCSWCGYWAVRNSNNPNMFSKSNCYTLEFSTVSGDSGKFTGTKEEIHNKIDTYEWTGFDNLKKEEKLRMIAECITFLKYGYMDEFKNSDYETYEITIDNGLWMKISYGIWT